jgi:hypothetical protein
MSALDLTRADLIRALGAVTSRPAIDGAVRRRAEALAERIEAAGIDARVVRRGPSGYAVEALGPGLFAREFGSRDAPAEPVVGPAIDALAGREG